MKTVLALMLCSSMAFGEEPAPYGYIQNLPKPGRVLEVQAGNLVPFDATCYDADQNTRNAKVSAYFEKESTELQKGVTLPTPAFIALVAGGVVAVIVAGAAVAYAVKK
jgi:hypothetical protein